MKKVFGVQAEFNITADEDIVKGIGHGIKSGSIVLSDVVKECMPLIKDAVKEYLVDKHKLPSKGEGK